MIIQEVFIICIEILAYVLILSMFYGGGASNLLNFMVLIVIFEIVYYHSSSTNTDKYQYNNGVILYNGSIIHFVWRSNICK